MNRKITFVLALILLLSKHFAFGQGKSDYENDSRWFWGFNAGVTWQSTDVKSKSDWGWGFTLGKSFNYDYGRLLSFDLRGRFLHGEWYGQNTSLTNFDRPNQALSIGETNYKDSLGLAVLNFQSKVYRVAFELAIHANRLRERTGWDLYAFGGVGVTAYRTRGDLLDAEGSRYAYDQLPDLTTSTLSSTLDKKYETFLDGSSQNDPNYTFMPSLGFGLGYMLGKRFSMGFEHKTTFTLVDDFDGYNNPEGTRQNDLYHYTSAYLRFHIKSHGVNGSVSGNGGGTTDPMIAPEVFFTNPSVSGATVTNPNYQIRATVKHVNGRENINFRQNGAYIGQFSYNANTDRLESNVVLQPGQNIFEIIASNAYGSAQAQTIVIYEQQVLPPPIVTFINPASNPHTTSDANFNVVANVLNLQNSNQATVTVNGQNITNFNFNPANGKMNFGISLTVGTNIVSISATNASGTDAATATIIYNPAVSVQPPVVYFTNPAHSPYKHKSNNYDLEAQVMHVDGRQNITFKQNGTVNNNFSYNASSDEFSSHVILSPGQNVFEIIASNASGTAQATSILIYDYVAPRPPVVTITNPATSPYTTENVSFPLAATVLNVSSSQQIKLTQNGNNIGAFSYNNGNNTLSALLNLVEGNNNITVSATNADGSDSKQTVIIYKKPVVIQPPVVAFINPPVSPYNTDQSAMGVVATVLNVTQSSQINVNINGSNFTGFSFNASNHQLTFNTNLLVGANVVTITATNTAGIDTKSSTIIYTKPNVVLPPVVNFTDPVQNPATVYNPSYQVKARVQHVSGAQQITVKVNGNMTSSFSYNMATEILSLTTGLNAGANLIEVTAVNTAGADSKSTTIIFKKSEPLLPPVVNITTPVVNPYTSSTASTAIEATILNVESAQNISVTVNNQAYNGFSWNQGAQKLSFSMTLNEGSNTVQIKAVNAAGESTDARTINYTKVVKMDPPLVTFIQPVKTGTSVSTPNYTVRASILNIDQASQIEVKQNGQIVNPALFTWNASIREMQLATGLSLGNNIFVVKASNASGTHSATTNITLVQIDTPCDKPGVKFLLPNASGIEIAQSNNAVKLNITGVSAASDIQLYLNGKLVNSGTFNPSSRIFDANVSYVEGQNTLEVVAKNTCGETRMSTTVLYKPAGKPCEMPVLQLIEPLRAENNVVDKAEYEIRLGYMNISNPSEINFKLNGQQRAIRLDQATHLIIETVALLEGPNTIEVIASNDCGSVSKKIQISRKSCVKPAITITSGSIPNKGTTYLENLILEGNVSQLAQASQLVLTHNGKEINYVYNQAQQTFSASVNLIEGPNNIILKAQNDCGSEAKTYLVTRQKDPNALPPVIQITNPATTPYPTETGAFSMQAVTQYVTANSQVTVTVNGQRVNANFNAQNGSLSCNLTLVEGNNVIVASAVNNYGSSSDTKTIVYKKPVVVQKPQIVLTTPASCPATLPAGTHQIKGYILNITDLNQVSIKINGSDVSNFNPVLVSGKLNFQFTITLSDQNNNLKLDITAQNTGGSDAKSCEIKMKTDNTNTGCMPQVSAVFSTDSKTVTANSTKDLSNVVLKYFDGTVQKFDGLTGLTRNFSGTGANIGKCIIGVWIKSGCNQSADGPGYGEWVANTQNVGNCSSGTGTGGGTTDCKPNITATFNTDSRTVHVVSTKELINVVIKFYDGQEQRYDGLKGTTRSFAGTGANAAKCIIGVWVRSGCNASGDGPDYGEWFENKNDITHCTGTQNGGGNGNNGHGNNDDGNDESNPGQGGGGPNGQTGGGTDDESGKGGGKNTGGSNTGGGNNNTGGKPNVNGGSKTGGNTGGTTIRGTGTNAGKTGTTGNSGTGKTGTPSGTTGTKTTTPTNTSGTKTTTPTNTGGTKTSTPTGGSEKTGTKVGSEGEKGKTTTPPPTKPLGTRGGGL